MDKKEFNQLTIPQQIEYINILLQSGQTLQNACDSLNFSRASIRERFSKNGYLFNSVLQAYSKQEDEAIQTYHKEGTKPLAKQEDTRNTITDNTINNSQNKDNNIKENVSNNTNGNMVGNKSNSIVINKTVNVVKPKRTSYYLNVSTIRTIEQLAKQSNKGISNFLQELLNVTLDKIKIE